MQLLIVHAMPVAMPVAMVGVYPCVVVYQFGISCGNCACVYTLLVPCDVSCVHAKECVLVAVVMFECFENSFVFFE